MPRYAGCCLRCTSVARRNGSLQRRRHEHRSHALSCRAVGTPRPFGHRSEAPRRCRSAIARCTLIARGSRVLNAHIHLSVSSRRRLRHLPAGRVSSATAPSYPDVVHTVPICHTYCCPSQPANIVRRRALCRTPPGRRKHERGVVDERVRQYRRHLRHLICQPLSEELSIGLKAVTISSPSKTDRQALTERHDLALGCRETSHGRWLRNDP